MALEKCVRVLRVFLFYPFFIVLMNSNAHAVSFYEMPVWNPAEKYKRGSVVSYKTDIYISIVPQSGLSPHLSRVAWRKIEYNRHHSFRPYKLYLPGTVVAHDGKYYLSKKINVPKNASALDKSDRWLEFTHPAMGFDLPEYTETPEDMVTLLGVDTNANGIRDDYETTIIMGDLPAPVKTAALAAGTIYGKLIATGSGPEVSSASEAQDILQNMVLAKLCQRQLAKQVGASWPESSYFNTLDRVEAKYMLQNALTSLIDQNSFSVPTGDPCEQLKAQ